MTATDVAEGAVVGGAGVDDGELAGVDDEVPTGAAVTATEGLIEGGAEVGTTGAAQATIRVSRIDG